MSRAERVAEQIKMIVSGIISKDLKDPGIGFTTITKVSVSTDIKNASLYISVLGNEKQKISTMEALERATGFIKNILGQKLKLRLVPKINFIYDDSLEKASRVWNLINKINEQDSRRNT